MSVWKIMTNLHATSLTGQWFISVLWFSMIHAYDVVWVKQPSVLEVFITTWVALEKCRNANE